MTLYEKQRIGGSQKGGGCSMWLCRCCKHSGMQLTHHATNDECSDENSRTEQTSDEQTLINSVLQLQT